MATTYLDLIDRITRTAATSGPYARALFGSTIGMVSNILMEGLSQAVINAWIRRDDVPLDAIFLIGAESRLPVYQNESVAAYKARVENRWQMYEFTASAVTAQIAAAGLNGTVFLQIGHPGPNLEPNYWSQFWILTTETDSARLATITAIANKWKPVDWIFRGFVYAFVDSGDTCFAEPTFAENSWAA